MELTNRHKLQISKNKNVRQIKAGLLLSQGFKGSHDSVITYKPWEIVT